MAQLNNNINNNFSSQEKSLEKKLNLLTENNKNSEEKIKKIQEKFDTEEAEKLTENQNNEKQEAFFNMLEAYEKIVDQSKENLENLKETRDSNMDFFTKFIELNLFLNRDNATNNYKEAYEINKNQAKIVLQKLEEKFEWKNLSPQNQEKLSLLKQELNLLINDKEKSTSVIKLVQNDIKHLPENINNAWRAHIWIAKWANNVMKWILDSLVGIWKYAVLKNYRQQVNKQIVTIADFCIHNLWEVPSILWSVLDQELNRISNLPSGEQSEAIWQMGWAVIWTIMTIGAWVNVGKEIHSWMTNARLLEKAFIHSSNLLINWTWDYTSKWTKIAWGMLAKVWKNLDLSVLKPEHILEIKNNLIRLRAWSDFLGRNIDDLAQQKAIIKAHETWTRMANLKYSIIDIRKKNRILKNAWFDKEDIRTLMEGGVCWDPFFKKKPKTSNKPKIKETHNLAKEADKVDELDRLINYQIDDLNLKPVEAKAKIEKYAKSIDIGYLINNPDRIDNMLDIVESMCDYIDKNSGKILKLDKIALDEFKGNFNLMRKKMMLLEKDIYFKKFFKEDFTEIYNNSIKKAYYGLNPHLLPKN